MIMKKLKDLTRRDLEASKSINIVYRDNITKINSNISVHNFNGNEPLQVWVFDQSINSGKTLIVNPDDYVYIES